MPISQPVPHRLAGLRPIPLSRLSCPRGRVLHRELTHHATYRLWLQPVRHNFLASLICRARQTCARVPPLGSWQHKYLVEAKGFEPLRCEDLGYSQAPSTTRPHLQNWLRTDAWHPLTLVNSQPPAPACLYGKSKTPQNGASGKSRTPYLLDRSQALCPDELRTRKTGAPCPHRTDDRSLTRRLLCQLS